MEKNKLDFFLIDGEHYGGDQNWHTHPIMNRGGCSAVTACEVCIYLAKTHERLKALYPYDAHHVTRAEFLSFFETMFRYVYPGIRGLTSIPKFMKMLQNYIATTGLQLDMGFINGDAPYAQAEEFIRSAIDVHTPVMYLMLEHIDDVFYDYEWHWFTVTGYETQGNVFHVDFATWGRAHRFSLARAWDTCKKKKGGMVCIQP